MLGVERRLTIVNDTRYLEFLIPTYISNLHAEWAAKWKELGRPWSEKAPEILMPANTILSVAGTEKHTRPSDAEIAETTALHMNLTGQIWLACIHAYSQRDRGIRSRNDGHKTGINALFSFSRAASISEALYNWQIWNGAEGANTR